MPFSCDEDQLLVPLRPAWTIVDAADIPIVELDGSRKRCPFPSECVPTEFVEPRPGGFIGPETHDPLQAVRADAAFVGCHLPYSTEPHSKWLPPAVKRCSYSHTGLAAALGALGSTVRKLPQRLTVTPRASRSITPSQTDEKPATRILIREGRPELCKCLRKTTPNRIKVNHFRIALTRGGSPIPERELRFVSSDSSSPTTAKPRSPLTTDPRPSLTSTASSANVCSCTSHLCSFAVNTASTCVSPVSTTPSHDISG